MMGTQPSIAVALAFSVMLAPGTAVAAAGVCDVDAASEQACIDAVQAGGTVVNDIFRDANDLTATQLPVFGQIYNAWPGCTTLNFLSCAGESLAPFDCPLQYRCATAANNFTNAATYMNALDRFWWQPCRMADHTLDVNGCPKFGPASCVANGTGGGYFPWEGLVFDLGGEANKVAIFAENDHGPQPCESLEYTVYLTNDPLARAQVDDPLTTGVDPAKWNRAVLTKVFSKGWEIVIRRIPAPGIGKGRRQR